LKLKFILIFSWKESAMSRDGYHTRQYALVLDALRAHADGREDVCVTADAIRLYLLAQGNELAAATVYRNLDKLVRSGHALRCARPEGQSAGYRCLDPAQEHAPHCHLLCVGCGALRHLRCDALEALGAHMQTEHRFRLDPRKTVIYGRCDTCAGAETEGIHA
jgi:Fur family ferric uptake transcriptional regulator